MNRSQPIGVFDSGIGGLSVLRWIREELPAEDLIYIADSGFAPYGDKPDAYVVERSVLITRFLLECEAKAVVVACNTATAAAISLLRDRFPVPIIGLEPGVKPALALTRSGAVGVLATQNTLQSEKFARLAERFRGQVRLLAQACPGLVEQVEKMDLSGPETRNLVEHYVDSLLKAGADTIVLGCTHYPFLSPLIEEIAGPGVTVIDTGLAVAREVRRRLSEVDLLDGRDRPGSEIFWTTGDLGETRRIIECLWPRSGRGKVEVRAMPSSPSEK